MPKNVKKKRDKAADFTKAKLKLGKGKQLANNAIDTSFKARSIFLPTQSIVIEKDASTPLTKRHLSFNDLITHLKHYSAAARKDAILGLRELLESHWSLLESNLTNLINSMVRIIGDEDAGVRKALLTFLAWLIPRIPTENLVPHAQLLILFTTSAQTHIFPEIRIDAVKLLDVFLESIPQTVVSGINARGHGNRVLDGYLGILNAGTKFGGSDGPIAATSTASVALSSASKLVVFNSLSTFLKQALVPISSDTSFSQDEADPMKPMRAWFLQNAFYTPEAFSEFEQLFNTKHSLGPITQRWKDSVDFEDDDDEFISSFPLANAPAGQHWTLQDLANVLETPFATESTHSSGAEKSSMGHLTRVLHSSLVATFLDHAPAAFSPSSNPSPTEVDLVLSVVRIARTLYKTVVQEVDKAMEAHIEELRSLLGYMSPYFPTPLETSKKIRFEQFYEEYNLIYCELTALLIITSKGESVRLAKKRKAREANRGPSSSIPLSKRNAQDTLRKQAAKITDFIIEKLRGNPSSSSEFSSQISPSAYLTLLPTIWTLINNNLLLADPEDQRQQQRTDNEVLQVALDHAVKVTSKAASKRSTVEFVSRLVLLDTHAQYRGSFKLGSAENERFKAWLLHLPQVLWELGNTNLLATETILRAMLRILQRRFKLLGDATLVQLRSRMAPYFTVNHTVRGRLPGPFCKLPAPSRPSSHLGGSHHHALRRLALDAAAALILQPRGGAATAADSKMLVDAVSLAVQGSEDESYWTHVAGITFPS